MREGLVRGDLFARPHDHYSALPNIVWGLGLTACELATYMYLIFRENRQTYRCHPSYEEIGKAIGRDKRSVPKYISGLVEKRLIEVEPTTLTLADGTRCNGTLEYHLLNPRIAVDHFNAQALSSGGVRVPKARRSRPRRERRPERASAPEMAEDDEENEQPL